MHINLLLELSAGEVQLLAGLIAIISMVVARLLEWYFPTGQNSGRTRVRRRRRVKKEVDNDVDEE